MKATLLTLTTGESVAARFSRTATNPRIATANTATAMRSAAAVDRARAGAITCSRS